jgi:hypothetical protein
MRLVGGDCHHQIPSLNQGAYIKMMRFEDDFEALSLEILIFH